MCEAITRKLADGRIEVASAGDNPAGRVHPLTFEQLLSSGYSVDGLHSKGIDALARFEPDAVITVCDQAAGDTCPVWLGRAAKGHWGLPDPSHLKGTTQEIDQAFSDVIDTIEDRVKRLLSQPFEVAGTPQLAELLHRIGEQS